MVDSFVLILALAAGLLFSVLRPLSRLFKSQAYWDLGIGAGFLILFVMYLMTAVVTPIMIEDDLAKEPCGSQSPQGSCYNLDTKLCQTIWEKSFAECKLEMASELKARPTALIGPVLNRCSARKMDKSVYYNRVNSATNYCKAYFQYLKEQR